MAVKKYTPRERINKLNAYNKSYHKAHYRAVGFQFNLETQADVLEWLDQQENKTSAIVALIRDKIASTN